MKKTFADLYFVKRRNFGERARMNFNNGYGISVLLGKMFYSNGKNTYEVAVLYNNRLAYDVLGWQTAEQVTEIMSRVQDLK